MAAAGRTPQGVRGLKYCGTSLILGLAESHPARGAWIEISVKKYFSAGDGCRTPQGVRGLKSAQDHRHAVLLRVAPRKGCVD